MVVVLSGCSHSEELPNGHIQTTQDGSSTLVLKGYESSAAGFSVFKPTGFDKPFYIQEKKFFGAAYDFAVVEANSLTDLTVVPSEEEWTKSVDINNQTCYWARYSSKSSYKFLKVRVAYIDGNNVGLEYIVDSEETRPNGNANIATDKVSVTSLEIPHLNSSNTYADHFIKVEGENTLNFALEWNAGKKHASWVAFSFDKFTCQSNVSRTNAWGVDPQLPVSMQVTESEHKSDGFDKGHICGSADRLYSTEANNQTFYYSNMSPMCANFNQVFWTGFESTVRNWGNMCATGAYDKVYVTKGGTLDQLAINFIPAKAGDNSGKGTDANGYTIHGIACPKYYFMAVLSEKDGKYKAVGFFLEHKEGYTQPSADVIKSYAISIDELEKKTGLDFFCNLEDDIEDQVESSFSAADWSW